MNSRKNTLRSKPKLLVDTSFLLPAMGVDLEKEILEAIECFRMVEVHYLEVSILEAMWKIAKVVPIGELDLVKEGIEAITETYKRVSPPPEAYVAAYKLYHEGHRDYIDNLLYTTSQELNLLLLRMDREFIAFLGEKGLSLGNILTPDGLKRMLKMK